MQLSMLLCYALLTVNGFDLLCDIVDNDDAMRSSVVAGGDGSEPLLTGRVPLHKTEPH